MKNSIAIPVLLSACLASSLAWSQARQSADTDGDGNVSKDEFLQAHAARGEELFARLDKNADGLLSQEELRSQRGEMRGEPGRERPRMRPAPEDIVARLDTDGSGGLSMSELEGHRFLPDEAHFAAADLDGNSELSADELARVLPAERK